MKLERIIARNIMGTSFDEKLTAANVFIATNWAGKTARANAITVLLLGYLPRLGKRNQDTARLMSSREMHLEGHFTGGLVMSRTFKMSGASVKCEAKLPAELCGSELAIMLNANEYFAKTDQERRDYVFGLLDLSAMTEFSPASMTAEVVKAVGAKDAATTKAVETVLARITEAVKGAEGEMDRDASCEPGEGPELTPQAWLGVAMETAGEFTKTAKEYAARMEKTVQGIATLRLQDTAPAVNLAGVEATRERLNREREAIVTRREELLARKKQIDAARVRRGRLTEMLRELQPRIEALADLKAKLAANTGGTVEAQRERETLLQKRLELNTALGQQDENTIRRRGIENRLASLKTARERLTPLKARVAEIDQRFSFDKLTAAGTEITKAEEAQRFNRSEQTRLSRDMLDYRRQISDLEAELEKFATATQCPTCGASGEGWKTLREGELRTKVQELSGKIAALSDEVQELVASEVELNAAVTAAKKTHTELMQLGREHDDTERQIGALEPQAREAEKLEAELKEIPPKDPALEGALSEANQKYGAAMAVFDARRSLEEQITKAEAAAGDVTRLNAELTALTPDDPEIDAAIETQRIALEMNGRLLNDADVDRRTAEKRQNDAQRAAEAEQQRIEALAEVAVSKTVASTLKEIQERFVKAAFAPVLKSANEHFGAILKTPLAYHDGEIGRWEDSVWISHKTFSGAEERLAYCAISIALAARSKLKLAIIDELGTVADVNVRLLLSAVNDALKSGFVTQFVGIDAGRLSLYANAKFDAAPLNVRDLSNPLIEAFDEVRKK